MPNRAIDNPEIKVFPDLSDDELKYRIERHLFHEMTSNISVGFADNDLQPLSLEEQRIFFKREDVRKEMEMIVLQLLKEYRADPSDMIADDWYRELIYDASKLGQIYTSLEQERVSGDYGDHESDEITYDLYKPLFPKLDTGFY